MYLPRDFLDVARLATGAAPARFETKLEQAKDSPVRWAESVRDLLEVMRIVQGRMPLHWGGSRLP